MTDAPSPGVPVDEVRERRRRIARWARTGKRVGYSLFGIAIVLFFVGFAAGYSGGLVAVIVVCLGAGSVVLAPAIIFAYAARAAERDDRARGL